MSRRKRRRTGGRPEPSEGPAPGGPELVEPDADGDWVLRPVSGAAATKPYRCPGCDQEIAVGVAHVVAWPEGRLDDRRHWHRACWKHRSRRQPKVQRSRGAPRY